MKFIEDLDAESTRLVGVHEKKTSDLKAKLQEGKDELERLQEQLAEFTKKKQELELRDFVNKKERQELVDIHDSERKKLQREIDELKKQAEEKNVPVLSEAGELMEMKL